MYYLNFYRNDEPMYMSILFAYAINKKITAYISNLIIRLIIQTTCVLGSMQLNLHFHRPVCNILTSTTDYSYLATTQVKNKIKEKRLLQ